MRIRNAANLDDAQLAMAGESIGRQLDEETGKARRDEACRGSGAHSGSGGN